MTRSIVLVLLVVGGCGGGGGGASVADGSGPPVDGGASVAGGDTVQASTILADISADISAYISATTQNRFQVAGASAPVRTLEFDDLTIEERNLDDVFHELYIDPKRRKRI